MRGCRRGALLMCHVSGEVWRSSWTSSLIRCDNGPPVLSQSGDAHIVRHLKFTAWPDHGVPRSCHQLVRFAHYMRAAHHTGPVTVHCSAGVGRAGVLICTDVILARIAKDLNVRRSLPSL